MSRREFTRKIKAQAALRANGKCESCAAVLKAGEAEYDHILADQLGGEPTLANCQVLCRVCHRGPGGKTANDIRQIRKSDRQRDKATGAVRAAGKLKSAGFPPTEKAESRSAKQSLPRRSLYAPTGDA